MSVKIQVSTEINRPVADVFHFFAVDHVRNHPRWDPDMELEQVTDGPMGVGTVIRRRHNRTGKLIEGTMEIVEFEPNRAVASVIHDGPVEIGGRTTFEAISDHRTNMTFNVEFRGEMYESINKDHLSSLIERSTRNIKQLIESEL